MTARLRRSFGCHSIPEFECVRDFSSSPTSKARLCLASRCFPRHHDIPEPEQSAAESDQIKHGERFDVADGQSGVAAIAVAGNARLSCGAAGSRPTRRGFAFWVALRA